MKKIAISLGIIGVVAAIVIGATTAYFSDTETSTGNTFTAGTLDLTLEESDGVPITLTNMAPGDSASGTITVQNSGTGSMAGKLYATSNYVESDGGDTSAPDGEGINMTEDEVAKMLLITDFTADGDNILSQIPDVDDDGRITVYDMVNDITGLSLSDYSSPGRLETWYSYDDNMISGGSHDYSLTVEFDSSADNRYQGDGITLTFTFLLTQLTQ